MNRLRQYRYELIALIGGAVVMVLELVGARMIAPYFGSSLYVWTAVIGVILGAMAWGHWYGGRLADRGASRPHLALIMALAAAVLLVSLVLQDLVLALAAHPGGDVRWQALVAALWLFGPVNAVLGLVSPYVAKLKLTSLEQAGRSVGQLYAAATAGSIIGTFAAGYWLITVLGNRVLGLWLVVVLVATSFLASTRPWRWIRVASAVAVVGLIWSGASLAPREPGLVYDGDSAYARYQVVQQLFRDQPARLLLTDNLGAQSGTFVNQPNEPAFDYIRRFVEVAEAAERPQRILMIGGGTYTLPRLLHQRLPQAQIDVVEIDPQLDEVAKRYFFFQPSPQIRIIHEDGRVFLNRNHTKYDLIYVDAFTSLSPPVQLTTTETTARFKASLTPNGAVAVNIVSAYRGAQAGFLAAELATYRPVLPGLALVSGTVGASATDRQNIVVITGADPAHIKALADRLPTPKLSLPDLTGISPLTDDFAPVEALTQN